MVIVYSGLFMYVLNIIHELLHGLFAKIQGCKVYDLRLKITGIYMRIDVPDDDKFKIFNIAVAPVILTPIAFLGGYMISGCVLGGWGFVFAYLSSMWVDFLLVGSLVSRRVEKVYIWLLRKLKILGDE